VEVKEGQVCCRDANEDRIVVDYGSECCAGVPYSPHGAQLCCNGNLQSTHVLPVKSSGFGLMPQQYAGLARVCQANLYISVVT